MSKKKDPFKIKKSELNKFSRTYLTAYTPTNKKGKPKTEKVKIKGVSDPEMMQVKYKNETLTVPKKFVYKQPGKDLVFRPRKDFRTQFDGFKRLKGKYAEDKVKKVIKRKTKIPEFNLDRVKLVMPKLGKLPNKLF